MPSLWIFGLALSLFISFLLPYRLLASVETLYLARKGITTAIALLFASGIKLWTKESSRNTIIVLYIGAVLRVKLGFACLML